VATPTIEETSLSGNYLRILIAAAALWAAAGAAAQQTGAVIATDYVSSGSVARLQMEAPFIVAADVAAIHNDASGRWHDGLLYVVGRAGADHIQVLDPEQGFATVRQFSLGLGRGLRDIAFREDGTALVSCYDTAELLHVDPQTGAILQVISTAAFADADGLPETGWLLLHDGRLYVTCERLDRDNWYSPVGDSYLLVLDAATLAWVDCDSQLPGVQGILLAAPNPYTEILPTDDGRLLVGCNGYYVVNDGGVDVIDPVTLTSLGLEIGEAALGGDIVDLAVDGERRFAVISDSSFTTAVVSYGGGVTTVHQGAGYDHADIAVGGGLLYVADRRLGAAGIRVFDTISLAELTTGPVSCGLPPALVLLPPQSVVPVLDLPGAGLRMAAPWPNPCNPQATVALTAPAGAEVMLRVVDMRGRAARQVRLIAGADGAATWAFDGRDQAGRKLPSGVYRCVAEGAGGFAARSLTLVR
jgi:DNA-binding beta-propeller fold protein YncE